MGRTTKPRWFGESDSGATMVVVAVMMVVLLGVAALAVDVGALYSERRQLQSAADAAALAGVQELPVDADAARAAADTFAGYNTEAEPTINISSEYVANDTITVTVDEPEYGLFFARFLNIDTAAVNARAVARVVSPAAYAEGVMPFGIMSQEPSGTAPFGYVVNDLVRLKQPAQTGESGNFLFLSLTDPAGEHVGASSIYTAIRSGGVSVPVYLNEIYMTRPGMNGIQVVNKLGSWIGGDTCAFNTVVGINDDGTAEILDEECHRIIICPIILEPGPPVQCNWNDMNGSTEALIVGFAYFYVEAWGTSGNDCWIDGRFIRPVNPDEMITEWGGYDPNGAIAYKLVE